MIIVLRLDHRIPRDERASTHVALTARAFGASGVVYSGQKDGSLEESVARVVTEWGGDFFIRHTKSPLSEVKDCREKGYRIIHLTMYGVPADPALTAVKETENALIVVGGSQVPIEFYRAADLNVSVTNQPHSEIAALAIAIDRIRRGKEMSAQETEFSGWKIRALGTERGKKTERRPKE
jgi:tRNA (cytidine56-2'-O)-methyltransferase